MTSTISDKRLNMIPLSEPSITGNEWKYIKECLDTGWVSSVGSYVNRFEKMVAEYVGCKYGIAVVNGTSALHLSLLVCGIKSGDEVIVPTLTFVATANVVRYCRADPVFVDCDQETLCLDVEKLKLFLEMECTRKDDGYTYNKVSGRRIKAIIAVHIFGHPVEMDNLNELCQRYNIDIIEDATESLGSEYKGQKTGSFGKLACLSFNGNKIITSGGGGMVVTNDECLAEKVKHLSTQAKTNSIEYDHDEIGYNYRLTNIQAAMGVAQMESLDAFVATKRKNAVRYQNLFSNISSIEFLWEKPWVKNNFWFYTIKVSEDNKKPLVDYLISKNIQVRPIWKPIHALPMYEGCRAYKIESAINIYETAFNLPCSVSLKEHDIDYVVENFKHYFSSKGMDT
jgi:Predicted pyridoxal phosphate-dependent enzyme apparently involved in regulation of cell wall biogenesis